MGVSAATAYRLLQRAEAEGRVTHFGRGRATRYVLRAPLFQRVVGELPLYHVDASGHVHHLATLTGLADGGVLVRPPGSGAALSRLLLGAAGTGHFDDLPFFLPDKSRCFFSIQVRKGRKRS